MNAIVIAMRRVPPSSSLAAPSSESESAIAALAAQSLSVASFEDDSTFSEAGGIAH